MQRTAPIALLLLAFLIVAFLYAYFTPDWQAPDEPAHYNYIKQLAAGQLPIIERGDYSQAYQSEVISSRFDSIYSIDPFKYEDYQPPLYYLLQTPIYLLTSGSLLGLRLVSTIIGAGVVFLTYLIALALFPGRIWLALTAAAFVAFLPQHVAMMAAVNNDALAELLIAAVLLLLVRIVMTERNEIRERQDSLASIEKWRLLLLGLLLGLGFVTKVTVYILLPIILVLLIWLYRGHRGQLLRVLILVFAPALTIGLVWWIRNIVVYGDLDPLGTFAHNATVVGQPRTEEWLAKSGTAAFISDFINTTFRSFWGQFGWMGVPMPGWVYGLLLLFSLAVVIGLIWQLLRFRQTSKRGLANRPAHTAFTAAALLMIAVFLLSFATYIGYNFTFVQHQGRYLFPALVPISLGVAVGLSASAWTVNRRRPNLAYLLPLTLAASLVALDMIALFRFILPSLT